MARRSSYSKSGITKASVTIVGESKSKQVELIVDTGSILTRIRSVSLKEVGGAARREKEFRTIEGRTIVRKTGPATVRVDGERLTWRSSLEKQAMPRSSA